MALYGQMQRGIPMNERECVAAAVEHLRGARDSLRGMAQLRGDMRWLLPVRLLDEIADRVQVLQHRGGPPLLLLPHREPRR